MAVLSELYDLFYRFIKAWDILKANQCSFFELCFFSLAYYPSHSVKKPSYLNTGLTSTKNYGKTILTKVCTLLLKLSSLTNLITGYSQFCYAACHCGNCRF